MQSYLFLLETYILNYYFQITRLNDVVYRSKINLVNTYRQEFVTAEDVFDKISCKCCAVDGSVSRH